MQPLIMVDFDGTIVDSLDTTMGAWNAVAVEKGYREVADREHFRKLSSRALIKSVGVSIFKMPRIIKDVRAEYEKRLSSIHIHRDVPEILRSFKKQAIIGIVSSNRAEYIEEFLKEHNLSSIFSFVEGGSHFGKNKVMKRMVKHYGVPKDQCLYIGDETRDVHSARRAGIPCLAVSWGLQLEEVLLTSRPAFLARTSHEFKEILSAWISSIPQ